MLIKYYAHKYTKRKPTGKHKCAFRLLQFTKQKSEGYFGHFLNNTLSQMMPSKNVVIRWTRRQQSASVNRRDYFLLTASWYRSRASTTGCYVKICTRKPSSDISSNVCLTARHTQYVIKGAYNTRSLMPIDCIRCHEGPKPHIYAAQCDPLTRSMQPIWTGAARTYNRCFLRQSNAALLALKNATLIGNNTKL